MLLKKKLLLGSMLAIISAPVISYADLVTINETNEESAVRITSVSLRPCTGDLGHYTSKKGDPSHNPDVTNLFGVKILCGKLGGSGDCTADMYVSKNCSGNPIANLTVSIPSLNVTVNKISDPRYSVVANGSNVYIRYANAQAKS